jgi:hypothetical protein
MLFHSEFSEISQVLFTEPFFFGNFRRVKLSENNNNLAHQQAVHLSDGKLHKLNALSSKVLRERWINAREEFCHALDATLDAGLHVNVVVLDPVQQT